MYVYTHFVLLLNIDDDIVCCMMSDDNVPIC